jgi:hypothetical protein
MPLECLSCGQQFDEAVVRYYSDEMREDWQLPFVHINVNMLY